MKSINKQIKRTLSLSLAILLMLNMPMASLAEENGLKEDNQVEISVDAQEESVEETGEIEKQQIVVEEKEEGIEQEEESPEPALEETEEQPELSDAADKIYWGVTNGVLRISVSEVGGTHSGSFWSINNPHPWDLYSDEIKKVYVGDDNGTLKPTNMSSWFYDFSNAEEFHFENVDTGNVTDMCGMFAYCRNLKTLDLSSFDTGNVTDMYGMFLYCDSLKSLDLSSFDTGEVTNMLSMFDFCSSMESLDLSSFDTGKVWNMSMMFRQCRKLKTIYAGSDFSTGGLISGVYMFEGCTSIVGGNGTKYSTSYEDSTYARIDNEEHPGYFTLKKSGISRKSDDDHIKAIASPSNSGTNEGSFANRNNSTGTWFVDQNNVWHFTTPEKTLANTWAYLPNPYAKPGQNTEDWFYFDEKGNMVTGWQYLEWNGVSSWYFFKDEYDGTGTYGAWVDLSKQNTK